MEITQVKVYPVHEDKLKAFVSVVFDHCFMVNDIKVIQGKDGLFLSMPSRRKKSGEFKDVAHPLNNETRKMLEERVLSEYRREVDDITPRRPDREDEDVGDAPDASMPATIPRIAPVPPLAAVPSPMSPSSIAASTIATAGASDKTLEEVQEMHLQDSFWSVS